MFEMLYGVSQIDGFTRDAFYAQRLSEHKSGRSDEGPTAQILMIARLLADHDDASISWPFAKHDLGSVTVQTASAAILRVGRDIDQG